jgi:hypothetical protein
MRTVGMLAFAMAFIVLPFAIINLSVSVVHDSLAIPLVFLPLAFVGVAVEVIVLPLSIPLAVLQFAFKPFAVIEEVLPRATEGIVLPIAGVNVPVRVIVDAIIFGIIALPTLHLPYL